MTFSEPVRIGTGGGDLPTLALTVGDGPDATTKAATYYAGGNVTFAEHEHEFRYEVAEGDEDTDGISIAADALELNGGTIRSGRTDASLKHTAVAADAGHKVDGVRPTVLDAKTTPDGAKVDYATADGLPSDMVAIFGFHATDSPGGFKTATGGESCTTGVDYVSARGTLTFAPGERSRPCRWSSATMRWRTTGRRSRSP